MPRYQAVFFDFGNTLAPASPVPLAERIRRTYSGEGFSEKFPLAFPGDGPLERLHGSCSQRAGWPVSPAWEEQVRAYYHAWARELLTALGAEEAAVQTHAEAFAEAFRDLSDRERIPYHDTFSTLDRLKEMGLRLAIVSNNDGCLARRLRYMGLLDYFETVADSAIVRSNKPDAGIFRHVLERMRLAPEAVLHVGDLYGPDVEGAGALGMDGAWINRAGDPAPESKHAPRFIIEELGELPPLLKE